MTLSYTLILGAFCLGFLIGWLVYFMNRHRKGEVSLADLGVLVGIFAGSGVAGLLGGAPGAPLNPDAAGAYCIGLLVGFLSYLAVLIGIVRRHRDQFDMLYFVDGRRIRPSSDYDFTVQARPMAVPKSQPSPTDVAAMSAILEQAVTDINVAMAKLDERLAIELDAKKDQELESEKNTLLKRKITIMNAQTILDFSRPDVIAAIAALNQLGSDLTTEAQRMKDATAAIAKAADVIAAVEPIVAKLAEITS